MAKTKTYQHFCPVARALEVIGEKWSLLIVRDLLRGPQRFTDLARYLGNITPKWLTLRLRELEAAGIVEADREPGRREVWYRLTPRGRELAPVVESLAVWGIDHAMRPRRPDESINPANAMAMMTAYRNGRGVTLSRPAAWVVRFDGDVAHTLRWDGARWSTHPGEAPDPDLLIETTPEAWIGLLTAPRDERGRHLDGIRVEGDAACHDDFLATLGAGSRPAEAPTSR